MVLPAVLSSTGNKGSNLHKATAGLLLHYELLLTNVHTGCIIAPKSVIKSTTSSHFYLHLKISRVSLEEI